MARFLISGTTGLIGSELVCALRERGDDVISLVRHKNNLSDKHIFWDPYQSLISLRELEGLDAVIHLGGDPIASGRWTATKKERILQSRVIPTRFLSDSLAKLEKKPSVFIVASAIGFYGHRGDEVLTEHSMRGVGFLPDVAAAWEQTTHAAETAGIRVVHARFGIVLSEKGGALKSMLPPFRLGIGGRLGSGSQWMSWVSLQDVVGLLMHAYEHQSIRGPLNVVAPNPVTNQTFTRTLANTLNRAALLPVPAWGLRVLLGEMADALLLSSIRVLPEKAENNGYHFQHPLLAHALDSVLKK